MCRASQSESGRSPRFYRGTPDVIFKFKMANIKRLHAIVTGNVQGVGFRFFVQKTALTLGLAGWVRNLSNGDVELEAEGDAAVLESFLGTLKIGHHWAQVSDVEVNWYKDNKNYSDFEITD